MKKCLILFCALIPFGISAQIPVAKQLSSKPLNKGEILSLAPAREVEYLVTHERHIIILQKDTNFVHLPLFKLIKNGKFYIQGGCKLMLELRENEDYFFSEERDGLFFPKGSPCRVEIEYISVIGRPK